MLFCDMKKLSDDTQKWVISAVSAAIFLLIGSPFMYDLTQRYIAQPLGLKFITAGGAVTITGLLVHALVFFLIVRLMMMD